MAKEDQLGEEILVKPIYVVWEAHHDRLGRSGRKGIRYIETATAAAMALRAACSGIEIQDHTQTHSTALLHATVPW